MDANDDLDDTLNDLLDADDDVLGVEQDNAADVGILNDLVGADDDDSTANDGSSSNSIGMPDFDTVPDLWDVYQAMEYTDYVGDFCASDKADGTTLTPSLPSAPGLHMNGVGGIPLPLSEWHAKAIKSNRNTTKVEDKLHHNVYSVEARRIRMKNPAWDTSLKKLVQDVAYKLSVDPNKLSAQLDMLLLMEKGSHVKRCANAEQEKQVIGTLLVQLPSTFTGGAISLFNTEEDDSELGKRIFDMGASSGEAAFSVHFVCHYNKDCDFEISKILSGNRVIMRYSLVYNGGVEEPTVRKATEGLAKLRWSLGELPPEDRMVLVPVAKEYKAIDLVQRGINALSHAHRSKYEAVKAATFGKGWKVVIVNAEMIHNHRTDHDGYTHSSSSTSKVLQIFDEEGNDVTAAENWLKPVVNFAAIDDEAVNDGMLLALDEELTYESWGFPCSYTSAGSYYSTRTRRKEYHATFILAYDASVADVELQCLSGWVGVKTLVDRLIPARNYDLLERVLSVVAAKEKAKLHLSSCKKVLQTLMRATRRNARVELIKQTIVGLDPTQQPDSELYDAILLAANKLGHESISTSISSLLTDESRMAGLQLYQFLERCNFILKLPEGSSYLQNLCRDFPTHGARVISRVKDISSSIDSMITEHGSEPMTSVVKTTLDFMHRTVHLNKSIPDLLERAHILEKMNDQPYGFVPANIVEFAVDFALGLQSASTHTAMLHAQGEDQKMFVKAICWVMAHGSNEDLSKVGRFCVKDQELFPAIIEAIKAQANDLGFKAESLVRFMLNRCLVQQSAVGYRWWRHKKEDGTTSKSPHVQKIIEDYPGMTSQPSEDGRLTLHYAVANRGTSYDAVIDVLKSYPQAASIRCPISGLFPFMLAASNRLVLGASYQLLLANPSLIAFGAQNDDGSRKRKRSSSIS